MASAVLLIASATIAAAPAEQPASDDGAAEGAATGVHANAEAERKVCRTEKATGSLTRRTRICLTAAQWREINDRTRRGVDEMVGGASGAQSCKYEDPNGPPCY